MDPDRPVEPSEGLGFVPDVPPRRGHFDWAGIARRCRAQPGEPYQVFVQDHASLVVTMRDGRIAAFRPLSDYKIETRNTTLGHPRLCDLYITYLPMVPSQPHGRALADIEVQAIRALLEAGETPRALANRFQVTRATIYRVKNRRGAYREETTDAS